MQFLEKKPLKADKSLRSHAFTFPPSVRSRPRLSLPSPKTHLYKQLASSENAASPRAIRESQFMSTFNVSDMQ